MPEPRASGSPAPPIAPPRTARPARRSASPDKAPQRTADEIRGMLVDATIDLLSERPPGQIRVRDIATRAGLQHSLITRYFGSRDRLIAEATGAVAKAYGDAVRAAGDDPMQGFRNGLRQLEGRPLSALVLTVRAAGRVGDTTGERFPGFQAHLDQLVAGGAPDDLHTRVLSGMALVMIAGWTFVESTVLDAVTADAEERAAARADAEELMLSMLRGAVDGTTRPPRARRVSR